MSNNRFKDMDYETALKKLSSLISELENGNLSFDDTLIAYKVLLYHENESLVFGFLIAFSSYFFISI